jgi:methionyl-tRNA synthetase
MRDIATGYDSDFSEERILMSYNKELAGGLGNLLNRSLNMANRYREGVIKRGGFDDDICSSLRKTTAAAAGAYPEKMEAWMIHQGIEEAWKIVTAANGFIELTQPFKLAKDETQAARLDAVLHHLAESLVHVSVLLDPVMPVMCAKIREQLGWALPAGFTLADLKWGLLPDGHRLGTGTPLFPRVELQA